MTSEAIPSATYIGDTILMKYQEVILNKTLSQALPPDAQTNADTLHYCDFCVEGQGLLEAKKNVELLHSDTCNFKDKIVIMLGTYDIIDDRNANVYIARDLCDLLRCLRARNAKDIAVCTVPRIKKMTRAERLTLERYNDYI